MQCLANSLNLRLDNRIEKVLVNGRRVTTLSRSDVTERCNEPREDALSFSKHGDGRSWEQGVMVSRIAPQ